MKLLKLILVLFVISSSIACSSSDDENGSSFKVDVMEGLTPDPLWKTWTSAIFKAAEPHDYRLESIMYSTVKDEIENSLDVYGPNTNVKQPMVQYSTNENCDLYRNDRILLDGLEPNTTYYYRLIREENTNNKYQKTVGEMKSFTTDASLDEDGAVDLGLSVNWDSRNIGASKLYDSGKCFYWNSTQPCNESSWYDKHCTGVNICGTGNDVALRYKGDGWRMATKAEAQELYDCKRVLVIANYWPGIYITGPSGKHLFIPMCSTCIQDSRTNEISWVYWIGSGAFQLAYQVDKIEVSRNCMFRTGQSSCVFNAQQLFLNGGSGVVSVAPQYAFPIRAVKEK